MADHDSPYRPARYPPCELVTDAHAAPMAIGRNGLTIAAVLVRSPERAGPPDRNPVITVMIVGIVRRRGSPKNPADRRAAAGSNPAIPRLCTGWRHQRNRQHGGDRDSAPSFHDTHFTPPCYIAGIRSMPCTVLRKIKRVDDRAGTRVPIELELQVFAFTRFPNANRCPSPSKSGTGFRSKTLWLVKDFPPNQSVSSAKLQKMEALRREARRCKISR